MTLEEIEMEKLKVLKRMLEIMEETYNHGLDVNQIDFS